MSSIADETPIEEAKGECVLCGKALAGLGLFLGAFFLYIGIDVLTGGKLTTILGLGGKAPETEVTE